MMIQTLKKQKTETFSVVGVIHQGRTVLDVATDIETLASDLLSDASNKRPAAANAEAIMHMCADIIAMSKAGCAG